MAPEMGAGDRWGPFFFFFFPSLFPPRVGGWHHILPWRELLPPKKRAKVWIFMWKLHDVWMVGGPFHLHARLITLYNWFHDSHLKHLVHILHMFCMFPDAWFQLSGHIIISETTDHTKHMAACPTRVKSFKKRSLTEMEARDAISIT